MNDYTNRRGAPAPDRGPAYDPNIPATGCYRIRLGRGTVPSAVRVWLGPPIGPDGEEVAERGFRWQASINGTRVPLDQVWPGCARNRISAAEHDRIVAESRTMDQDSPFFDPRRPIDRLRAPPPF